MASQLAASADILSTLPSEDESELASLPPFLPPSQSSSLPATTSRSAVPTPVVPEGPHTSFLSSPSALAPTSSSLDPD